MLNDTGQRLFIVTEQDGEVLFKVEKGESVNVRSVAQTKNDKFYSPKSKINIRGKFIKVMDIVMTILCILIFIASVVGLYLVMYGRWLG